MNGLSHLQNSFKDHLIHPTEDFIKHIISTEKVPAEVRLAIYTNAYRSRLIDALSANYPILNIYLGHDQFQELALTYLDAHPSSYRSIRWFGDKLPTFLAENTYYEAFPYLSELAQFEWTQTLVFDAKEASVLTIEELGNIAPDLWGEMKFKIHPSAHRLNFSWNVVQIWQALSEEQSPFEPVQTSQSIPWILWRKELHNQFCSLTKDEAWAIDAMIQGLTFEEICEGLCQWVDEQQAAMHAASLLKGWIMSSLISEVMLPG